MNIIIERILKILLFEVGVYDNNVTRLFLFLIIIKIMSTDN